VSRREGRKGARRAAGTSRPSASDCERRAAPDPGWAHATTGVGAPPSLSNPLVRCGAVKMRPPGGRVGRCPACGRATRLERRASWCPARAAPRPPGGRGSRRSAQRRKVQWTFRGGTGRRPGGRCKTMSRRPRNSARRAAPDPGWAHATRRVLARRSHWLPWVRCGTSTMRPPGGRGSRRSAQRRKVQWTFRGGTGRSPGGRCPACGRAIGLERSLSQPGLSSSAPSRRDRAKPRRARP
jgi:hypothetical protein